MNEEIFENVTLTPEMQSLIDSLALKIVDANGEFSEVWDPIRIEQMGEYSKLLGLVVKELLKKDKNEKKTNCK